MSKVLVHRQLRHSDYPVCEPGALVQFVTNNWDEVTCPECLAARTQHDSSGGKND